MTEKLPNSDDRKRMSHLMSNHDQNVLRDFQFED